MTEQDRNDSEKGKSVDAIIITPKTTSEILAISTGTISPRRVTVIKSSHIFNASLWQDVSSALEATSPYNFSQSRSTSEETLYNMALKKIALYALGKEGIGHNIRVHFIEPDSIDHFKKGEGFEALVDFVETLDLNEEFNQSLNKMQLKAIIKDKEPYETIWQNPDSVPKP